MMRALEEHLSEWARRELALLGGQSRLFGDLRIVPPGHTGPPALADDETGLQVTVLELLPAPERQEMGPATGDGDHLLQFAARMLLRLFGSDTPRADGDEMAIQPSAAHMHRVDLVLLALLTLLRERQRPAPDGAGIPGPEASLGEAAGGAMAAEDGARRVRLDWQIGAVGAGTVQTEGRLRVWELPLTATCTFRLSPVALEGGRILQVDAALVRKGGLPGRMELALYAPAEAIALDHFGGLSDMVLTELSSRGVRTFGDLSRLGPTGALELAGELQTAADADRTALTQLAQVAAMRSGALGELAATWLDPGLLALPARALLAPTAAEQTVMSRVMLTPAVAAAINVVGAPVAAALRPEYREAVTVGTLLMRGRS